MINTCDWMACALVQFNLIDRAKGSSTLGRSGKLVIERSPACGHRKGLHAEAISHFEKARALIGGETFATATGGGWLGYTYAVVGRKSEAQNILNDSIARSKRAYVSSVNIATIYLGLGEKEHAFEWLQRGYDERDGDMVLLNVWPVWDPLPFRSALSGSSTGHEVSAIEKPTAASPS